MMQNTDIDTSLSHVASGTERVCTKLSENYFNTSGQNPGSPVNTPGEHISQSENHQEKFSENYTVGEPVVNEVGIIERNDPNQSTNVTTLSIRNIDSNPCSQNISQPYAALTLVVEDLESFKEQSLNLTIAEVEVSEQEVEVSEQEVCLTLSDPGISPVDDTPTIVPVLHSWECPCCTVRGNPFYNPGGEQFSASVKVSSLSTIPSTWQNTSTTGEKPSTTSEESSTTWPRCLSTTGGCSSVPVKCATTCANPSNTPGKPSHTLGECSITSPSLEETSRNTHEKERKSVVKLASENMCREVPSKKRVGRLATKAISSVVTGFTDQSTSELHLTDQYEHRSEHSVKVDKTPDQSDSGTKHEQYEISENRRRSGTEKRSEKKHHSRKSSRRHAEGDHDKVQDTSRHLKQESNRTSSRKNSHKRSHKKTAKSNPSDRPESGVKTNSLDERRLEILVGTFQPFLDTTSNSTMINGRNVEK